MHSEKISLPQKLPGGGGTLSATASDEASSEEDISDESTNQDSPDNEIPIENEYDAEEISDFVSYPIVPAIESSAEDVQSDDPFDGILIIDYDIHTSLDRKTLKITLENAGYSANQIATAHTLKIINGAGNTNVAGNRNPLWLDSNTSITGSTNKPSDSINYLNEIVGMATLDLSDFTGDIGYAAFKFAKVSRVILPENAKVLPGLVFYGCSNLTTVGTQSNIQEGIVNLSSIEGFEGKPLMNGHNVIQYAFGASGVTTVVLGSSITELPDGIFYNSASLTTLSATLTGVQNNPGIIDLASTQVNKLLDTDIWRPRQGVTFYGCSSITQVTLGKDIKRLPNAAFQNCSLLSTIGGTLGDIQANPGIIDFNSTGVEELAAGVNASHGLFSSCSEVNKIAIGSKIEKLPYHCFRATGVTSLNSTAENVKKPENERLLDFSNTGIQEIGEAAFSARSDYADGFTSVALGKNVKTIAGQAFANQVRLRALSDTAANARALEAEAIADFASTGVRTFLPAGVSSGIFVGSAIQSVAIGTEIEKMGYYLFDGCSELSTLNATVDDVRKNPGIIDFRNTGIKEFNLKMFGSCRSVEAIALNPGPGYQELSGMAFWNAYAATVYLGTVNAKDISCIESYGLYATDAFLPEDCSSFTYAEGSMYSEQHPGSSPADRIFVRSPVDGGNTVVNHPDDRKVEVVYYHKVKVVADSLKGTVTPRKGEDIVHEDDEGEIQWVDYAGEKRNSGGFIVDGMEVLSREGGYIGDDENYAEDKAELTYAITPEAGYTVKDILLNDGSVLEFYDTDTNLLALPEEHAIAKDSVIEVVFGDAPPAPPVINPVTDADTHITGTGEKAGNSIFIHIEGYPTFEVTVNSDLTWDIELGSVGIVLSEGDVITATQKDNETNLESEQEAQTTVVKAVFTVTLRFLNGDNSPIAEEQASGVGYQETFSYEAPAITNYTYSSWKLDGVEGQGATPVIDSVQADHTIDLVYQKNVSGEVGDDGRAKDIKKVSNTGDSTQLATLLFILSTAFTVLLLARVYLRKGKFRA